MASNVYQVKVIGIEHRETLSDKEEVTSYKRIEVIQEVGWWIIQFTFNMFPNHKPYETVSIGDKLFLRVSSTLKYLISCIFLKNENADSDTLFCLCLN